MIMHQSQVPPGIIPVNAYMEGDVVTLVVMIDERDTMDDVARKVAFQVVGRRVRERDGRLVVQHQGRDLGGETTVQEAGIRPRASVFVRYL